MIRILVTTIIALFMTSCTVLPQVDYSKHYDFSSVATYAWLPRIEETEEQPKDLTGILDSDLTQGRIVDAIDRKLQSIGWQLVAAEDADVLVTYHLRLDTRTETISRTDMLSPYGWPYARPYPYGYGFHERRETEYEVGTILIDLLEPASERNAEESSQPQLIWRAVREGRLRNLNTIEEREEAINHTVDFLFSTFPPGSSHED